jgi:hypothetical protein
VSVVGQGGEKIPRLLRARSAEREEMIGARRYSRRYRPLPIRGELRVPERCTLRSLDVRKLDSWSLQLRPIDLPW